MKIRIEKLREIPSVKELRPRFRELKSVKEMIKEGITPLTFWRIK